MRLTVVLLLQALVFLNGQFCSGRKDEDGKQLVLEGNPVRKYDDDKGNICYMDGPLRFLNDLKDCKIVVGDIVFARNATGTFDAAALKEVHGCIQIIETQLFSIEWLIGTKIHCKGINKVYSNPLLCANITARENLDMTPREYNIVHEKCPTCLSSDFTKPCPTLFGDIVYNESYYQLLKSVKLLNGRLKFLEGAVIPSDFHFDLEIVNGAHDGPEAAVQLIGCSMPNISDLINLKIKTYATVSIVIRNITGFIYPRHKMLELKSKLDKYGDVEIETEKDGDCYIPYQYEENQPPRTSVEEVLNCVSIYGKIILDANGNSPVANVMSMHSTESIYLTEKRADLGRIFANLRKIELFGKTSFLHIKFDDNVCYKSDIIARIKSALPATDHYKLKVDLTNCNKYKGFVLGKDLIQDDGSRLEHVIGLLYLEPLVMTYPSDYKKWHWDYNRFKNLKTIHKPSYMPADSAALTIEMCGHRVKIPQFITKINVTSERNDDILVRIIGPGYKMERTMFDLILKKYGPTRIDIEPKYPGECNFDSPISDLSKLNGCERIIGDLRMTGKIIGNTTSTIKQITGCIHIVNTTLTNLDFINLEVPYNEKYCQSCWGLDGFAVQHNKNLCANHWMFKVDKEKVAFNKPGCGNEVDEEAYPERNIIFYGSSNNTDFEDYSYIKILKGRIIVANTNIEAFDFFSSLEKIIYIGLGPAVLIHSNSNLSSVTFPKLKEIIVRKGQKAVFMKNNPNLNFNDSQVSQMKKLSNGDIEIDNEQKEKKDLMTDGIKLGVGSGIGAVAAILILIILVAVTMILVKKFKNGKKSTRNEKNNLLKNASTKQKKNNRNQHKCGEKIQSKESNHTVASRNSRKTKKTIEKNPCIPYPDRLATSSILSEYVNNAKNENFLNCECVPPQPVRTLSCGKVDGDLILDRKSESVIGVTDISGCIRMVNTSMRNYDFLVEIKSFNSKCIQSSSNTEFSGNPCIPLTLRKRMQSDLQKILNDQKNRAKCGECFGGKVETLDENCIVVIGNLIVNKITSDSKTAVEQKLSSIQEIHGSLIFVECHVSSLRMANLREIVAENLNETPLEISNNPELKSVDLPKLQKMVVDVKEGNASLIRITNNPKWKPSETFLNAQKKVTGTVCSSKPHSACYMENNQQSRHETSTESEKHEDSNTGLVIGVCITVVGVILLIGAGGLAAVFILKRKKNSRTKKTLKAVKGKDSKNNGRNEQTEGGKASPLFAAKTKSAAASQNRNALTTKLQVAEKSTQRHSKTSNISKTHSSKMTNTKERNSTEALPNNRSHTMKSD